MLNRGRDPRWVPASFFCARVSVRNLVVVRILAVVVALLLAGAIGVARAADEAAPAQPKGPLVPGPGEPLKPRAFTLEDRYLDAARRGDIDTLKLCIEKGVNDKAKDGFERDALLLAASEGRRLDMVKLLDARGLPIDAPDVRGIAAIGYAAGNGQLEIVSYLIERGAKVDRKDVQQMTPLVHAVLGGDKPTVARLIEAGADVNSRDQFKDTPLIAACNKGQDDIAKLLVEKGADPLLEDQEGRTASERATSGSQYCRDLASKKSAS